MYSNAANGKKAIYKISGKNWSNHVDKTEKGNFDYLMFADLDYSVRPISSHFVTFADDVHSTQKYKKMLKDGAYGSPKN